MIVDILPRKLSSVENTTPEKNMGQVRIIVVAVRPIHVEAKPPVLAIHHPISKLASSST
jgi:hypothetical protein